MQLVGAMSLRLVLASLLAAGAQAFDAIWWTKFPAQKFVVAPISLPSGALDAPKQLAIRSGVITMTESLISFESRPDKSIAWNGMKDWCVEAGGDSSGAAVQISRCTGAPAQKWNWLSDQRGRKMIQLDGSSKCLNVADQEGDLDGAPIKLQECDSKAAALWQFEGRLPLPTTNIFPGVSPLLRQSGLLFFSVAALAGLSFGAGLFWQQKRRQHASDASTMEEGGLSLTTPVNTVAQQADVPLISNMVPAAMSTSPSDVPVHYPKRMKMVDTTGSNRVETDSMGNVGVPDEVMWGAQTQRSLYNFGISDDYVPLDCIYGLAIIKKACAITNHKCGILDESIKDLIVAAADEVIAGKHDTEFPLRIWMTGSGTQSNMNVNEVISNLAIKAAGGELGSKTPVHPNDHVNKSQSTNDAFPAAMHIATALVFKQRLLPELEKMVQVLDDKAQAWKDIIKLGRTHMQDACPLSLGQEVSGWRDQIKFAATRIDACVDEIYALPLGGTAVGSGLNTPEGFAEGAAAEIATLTGLPFTSSPNKFQTMGSHDCLVAAMGQLRNLACALFKVSNDIRLLSCGPRAGFGELILPENEPGSSIMPGKVNPTQCEQMGMVTAQVMGLDAAVGIAGSAGYLEMNVYKPLMVYNIVHSVDMLVDSCRCFREHMLEGMEPNLERIDDALKQSLMLVTALAPTIGYDKASKIAKLGHAKGLSLKAAALETGYVTEEEFDRIVDPAKMAFPHGVPDKV